MQRVRIIFLLLVFMMACDGRHTTLKYEKGRTRQAGGLANDAGKDIVVDLQENTYITGVFSDSARFDSSHVLTSAGAEDIFVAKYDNTGKTQWAINAGGSGSDEAHAVAITAHGGIGIAGCTHDDQTPAALGLTHPAVGDEDIFVARYDADGKELWRVLAGGAGSDKGTDVAFDSAGNCFVTGFFQGEAKFNKADEPAAKINSAGESDCFVAKYDATGHLLWVRSAGGAAADTALSIAVDHLGNCFVTGVFQDSAVFGSGQSNMTTLKSAGAGDVFVAQYDAKGKFRWARRIGGPQHDRGKSLVSDGRRNLYVVGDFFDVASVDRDSLTLKSAGKEDVFLARYDSAGALQWVRSAGGKTKDLGESVALGQGGKIYVSGEFSGKAKFGEHELECEDKLDIFVAEYDAFGQALAARRGGTRGIGPGVRHALAGSGRSFFTGSFVGETSFGDTTLTSDNASADVFAVAALAGGGVPVTELHATAISNTAIVLTWKDLSDKEEGFRIKRWRQGNTVEELDKIIDPNVRFYEDLQLQTNTPYSYVVNALYESSQIEASSDTVKVRTEAHASLTRHAADFALEIDNLGGGKNGWSYLKISNNNLLADGHLQIWTKRADGTAKVYDGDDADFKTKPGSAPNILLHGFNGRVDEHIGSLMPHEPVEMICTEDSLALEQFTYHNKGKKWALLEWTVINLSTTIKEVKLALFLDVDAGSNATQDRGGFIPAHQLAYVFDGQNRDKYVGVAPLTAALNSSGYLVSAFDDILTPDNSPQDSTAGESARRKFFAGDTRGLRNTGPADLTLTVMSDLGTMEPHARGKVIYVIAFASDTTGLKQQIADAANFAPCACPSDSWADVNNDGNDDDADIAFMQSLILQIPRDSLTKGHTSYNPRADVDFNVAMQRYCGNDTIDAQDLQQLKAKIEAVGTAPSLANDR